MTPDPQSDSLDARFAAQMGALLGPEFPQSLCLAVSGGADSMAMLALCHGWARHMGIALRVATVDHGLREGSAAEAAMVASECAALGHPHAVLRWTWDGAGNLQDAARRARLDLVGVWAGQGAHVLFGHTRDDLAETLLMRLGRGSGVDGLSAMAAIREAGPPEGRFRLVRPLLQERRATLRHYADTLRLPYADDPSNEDERFARVRMRRAIAALGLDVDGLAETAGRMARARAALDARTQAVAAGIAREGASGGLPTGILEIDRDGLARIERETQMRLLARAIRWVTSEDYPPRASALEDALDRALGGAGTVLHGAQIVVGRGTLHILREPNAVAGLSCPTGGVAWDGRWRLSGPAIEGCEVRGLGEAGWRQLPDRPADAPPHARALSLPAVFDAERLVAAPHFGFGPRHEIAFTPRYGAFVAGVIPH